MFEFQEKGHKYFYDDKPMTGVTTILGTIAKPQLISWASRMCYEYVKEHSDYDSGIYHIKEDELELAKNAHARKKTDAGDIGTKVHLWVEEYTKTNKCPVLPEDQKEKAMAEHFHKWVVENKVKFIASEKQVYNLKEFYAGTLDFLCEIDGKKYIGDFKTSSGIYSREYFAQCAGYRWALEDMGDKEEYNGCVIVRCGKKGDFEVKYSYDYQTDLDIFQSALKIYRLNK